MVSVLFLLHLFVGKSSFFQLNPLMERAITKTAASSKCKKGTKFGEVTWPQQGLASKPPLHHTLTECKPAEWLSAVGVPPSPPMSRDYFMALVLRSCLLLGPRPCG